MDKASFYHPKELNKIHSATKKKKKEKKKR